MNQYLEDSNINSNIARSNPQNTASNKKSPTNKTHMPYDGVCLKTGNSDSWMKSPDTAPFIPDDKLYTYLANQSPLKTGLSDQTVLKGPPIDGKEGSPTKMFMWANNVSSPICCPSTYTTSTGCLCTTKNQRDFIAARGIMSNEKSLNGVVNEIITDVEEVVSDEI